MRRSILCAGILLLSAAAAQGQSSLPSGTRAPDAAPAPAAQPSDPLGQAETLLATQKYAAARALLAPYLSAHPADARALFDMGYVDEASDNDTAAEAEYRKAIAADPRQFEAHSALGLLLAAQGKQADAVAELRTATALTPAPPNPAAQAQANRALAHLLEPTDPGAAAAALIAALKQSPETPADTLLAGEIANREGNSDAAADAYGKVLGGASTGSPERAEAAAGLAHLLIAARRYGDAEPVLRKALIENPTDPVLSTELADVLAAENKKADAVSVLETLHAAHPEDASIGSMLAELDLETGAADKATAVLTPLVAAHPQDPALLAEQGDALVRAGNFSAALPVLQQATHLDPTNGNGWSSLAFAASQEHQPQLVLDALAMRSKVMSETPATYFLAATAYDTLHQTKRAAALYKQFLAVAGNGFPDETWQARHRLIALEH